MSTVINPIYREPSASVADRVADLLERMTIEEKLGQMVQIDRRYLRDEAHLATFHLGSLLSGGGSAPEPNDAKTWADMVDRFQRVALSTRLGIPLLYGTDAVHGHNNLYGATIFPHNIGLGAANDPELVRRIGEATALEIRATGPRWTFAPCLAVARNERWGRTYESAGEHPALALTVARLVTGLQGETITQASVLATAKHYVGDGGTTGGADQGDTELPEEELRAIHLAPYVAAVAAGVGSIMASYSSWNGALLHGNAHLLNDLLKDELGFDGFVVSDWGGINALDGDPGFSAADVATAVGAGIDMIMVPEHYEEMLALLMQVVASGAISQERINDAVVRILRKKFELGLFENPFADRALAPEINSAAHRALARRAVRSSLVLLKNEQGLLPLAKDGLKIFVAGKNADNVSHQCGGWTLTWQGGSGPTVPGTSILDGIREVVGSAGTVDFAADGVGADGHDVAIVVIGEESYAEFRGDRPAPDTLGLGDDDLRVAERVAASGVPTVAVLVSGRPLVITEQLAHWDALVVAWLPGTEGGGVADVLFGEATPTGKLPHSWPRSAEQVPINIGDADYDPLFPYGFGLAYD
ncbi:MAG TPA: glycoside hydrolase family 3 N-terminal domain-containing protein [Cellulomonadaceae bacterium]|nr:glycoside hydrolase family 3 N-terminal domain-containing protein [Cellulomonadaceae bacterium]